MLRALLPFIAVLPSTAYSLICLACAHRFFRKVLHPSPFNLQPSPPPVTILKPVKGMDAGSYENFASFCRQAYTGNVQLLFAAASADDPVIAVINQLVRDFPGMDIMLTVNPAIHGPNYKVSNLVNTFPAAKHDIIIVCDSDIRVTPEYLQSVTSHFSDHQIGLVTSLYRTSCVHGFATAVEATGFTVEMVPNVMVALQLEGLSFALGASMAVRRQALASIGGFESLVDYLADDYQLGHKIHGAGWGIVLDSCFVESMLKQESLMTVISRQLRWARTMRASRSAGYLASGITLPFPAVILAALVAPSTSLALLAIMLLYGVRLTVACIFSRKFVGDRLLPRWLWLIPLRDVLAFATWALSFLGNRVEWRGNRFRLLRGGKLEEIV